MTTELTDAVAASVTAFGPRTERHPVYVAPLDGEEIVTAEQLLEPDMLHRFFVRALSLWGTEPNSEQLLAAAASRFIRRYCGSLASATLIPLAHGLTVDVSIPRISFVVREHLPVAAVLDLATYDEVVTCRARPSSWPVDAARQIDEVTELRELAMSSLFADNIAPAFRQVSKASHISRKLMWTTMAEQIDVLYESALGTPDGISRKTLIADREAVLRADRLPGIEGRNPLRDTLIWDRPGHPRRICCVNYVIPGRRGADQDSHCPTCPMLPLAP